MARRMRVLGWTGVVIAALALVAVFGLKSNRTPASGPAAPALPHEHLAGAPLTLAGLLAGAGGRASLVIFWASWCGPCATEAPAIERFSISPSGRGRIVGIDWSDALAGARTFLRRYSWTFPNLRDGEGLVGNGYHLTGLPTTFVLDGRGHIRTALRGPQSAQSLQAALSKVEHA